MNRLRELRARHRLTQTDLAEAVGCSYMTISLAETEKQDVSSRTAVRIAKFFGEPAQDIFFTDEAQISVQNFLAERRARDADHTKT